LKADITRFQLNYNTWDYIQVWVIFCMSCCFLNHFFVFRNVFAIVVKTGPSPTADSKVYTNLLSLHQPSAVGHECSDFQSVRCFLWSYP